MRPNPQAAECAGYHRFKDDTGTEYGSYEVFFATDSDDADDKPGWYWWACFPGMLPDGAPSGPFKTSREAMRDAQGLLQ